MLKPIRVVFLVHNIATWDCLHDVYIAMKQADDFDPIVVSINRNFPGMEGFHREAETWQALQALGIEAVRFQQEDSFDDLETLKSMKPDLLFRQAHWDNDVPPAFRTSQLDFTRLCYIPYGIMGMVYDERNRNHSSRFHNACWKIFLPNKIEYVEVARHRPEGKRGCHIVGHPSIEALSRAEPAWPISHDNGEKRFRLVWAPHHSIWGEWLRFGTFLQVYEAMLAWATAAQDIDFVLRPHPMLMTMLEPIKKKDGPCPIEQFFEAWSRLPNTAFSYEAVYASLFAASDMLLTDGIGFLLEYQLYRKPLVFLERSDRVPLMENVRILEQGLHPVHSVQEAIRLAMRFKGGFEDPLRAKQDYVCETLLQSNACASRILDIIREGLSGEIAV